MWMGISRAAKTAARVLVTLGALLVLLWATLAVYYSNLPWSWLRISLAVTLVLSVLYCAMQSTWKKRLAWPMGACLAVAIWWMFIPASNSGDYPPQNATLAFATIGERNVTVHNVRNFHYRTEDDFDLVYEDRTYDLDDLITVDFLISYWGSTSVAHTLLLFVFKTGDPLAVSVEIRSERGESFHPLPGLFKQFEIIYVWADERDVIGLRTNHRDELAFLYATVADPKGARELFLDMLRTTNELGETPVFYNSLTRNCTTVIVDHINRVVEDRIPFSHRFLLNGYSDELAYEDGWLKTEASFSATRQASDITERAKAAGTGADFSKRIRTHIAR